MTRDLLADNRPFTRQQALAAGFTDAQLRGKRFRQLFHGVYISAAATMTPLLWIVAALLASPLDAVISHQTALRLYGLELGELFPLHISTRTRTHARRANIRPHQRLAPIAVRQVQGVPVTAPLRTLVDIATKVTLVELIQAAEHMVYRGFVTIDDLTVYALEHHLDGVQRVRRVLGWIRAGVESPRESTLRLMIVFARLPEPRCNYVIHDANGRFLARGDLVYPEHRVVVEYDGWHHERSTHQRQSDLSRRERLDAAGWRVIVVTSHDMKTPEQVVRRVHRALVERGHTGRRPTFSVTWTTWFPTDDSDGDAEPQHVGEHVPVRAA
jgi:very-short-patch-repair endonuclease